MSLDAISMPMVPDRIAGAVLSLGYPELPDGGDAEAWLKEKGATRLDVVDVIQHKGTERLADLNEPQLEWKPEYRLVINPGTLEHCYNVGQAMANAWRAVAVGGSILHVAPASMVGHGFWNFCQAVIEDWCAFNGGRVLTLKYAENLTQREMKVMPKKGGNRGTLEPEAVMYALCIKDRAIPVSWPVQGIYRR